MSLENKERDHDQMPHLSTLLGGMFNRGDKPLREELVRVRHILRVTDHELSRDYRAVRVMKDIGARQSSTPEAAGAAAPAGHPN